MNARHPRLLLGTAITALAATLLIGCNKAPETAPAPSTTIGTRVDDTVITSRVKAALLADADIKSLDISVNTVQGEVQLTGQVDNQGQVDQAGQIAKAAEGAASIKNDLRIKQ